MRIPTHQIHNVLNAYARRLKEKHDAANSLIADNAEDSVHTYSVEEKRRLIINKISSDIIQRIARSGPSPRIVTPAQAAQDPSGNNPETEEIRYHILTKNGVKISAKMEIQDSDFLIRQLE
ncbi:MAG: hypothetical protein PF495_21480, partial [Spirochaetales bacterium]|nr:hypothetical protein [Spirochaetales bacterium]